MKKRNLLLSVTTLLVLGSVIMFTSSQINQNGNYVPRKGENAKHAEGFSGAMEYLRMLRANQITGTIDVFDILNARKQLIAMRQAKSGNSLGLSFIERGPDNVGGRTRAILVRKSNSNIIFAGAVSGGLWKSVNAGSSWTKVPFSNAAGDENLAVASITESVNGDIYIGTGEGLSDNGGAGSANGGSTFPGQGIWKSTDGGATFTHLTNTVPSNLNSVTTAWCFINRLAASPTDNGRIYAATNKGLMKTNDGGANWTNAILISGSIYQQGEATDVKVGTDGSVVAVVANTVYTSNDGITFTKLSSSNSTGLPLTGLTRIEVAIAPSDPNYIYASIAYDNPDPIWPGTGNLKGVYRSTDKGASWNLIGPGNSTNFNLFGSNGQGWYDNVLAVFPNNRDKIIAGGVDMWKWELNSSWENMTQWFANEPGSVENVSTYIHADQHAYIFDPNNPNTIYVGSDGGISKSIDGGNSWVTINRNYNVTQFYTVTSGAYSEVVGGTQDNGTLLIDGSGNTLLNASHILGGDGSWSCMSIINPKAVFASTYNAEFQRSIDKGANFSYFHPIKMGTTGKFNAGFIAPMVLWESINNQASIDSISYLYTNLDSSHQITAGQYIEVRSNTSNFPFYVPAPVEIDSAGGAENTALIKTKDVVSSKFFVGLTNAIYMTNKALDFTTPIPAWFKISVVNGTPQYMAYTKDGNNLFVGTDGGKLYRISNLLQANDSLTADVSTAQCVVTTTEIGSYGRAITSISVDPLDNNKVLITLGNYGNTNYVYYSTNAMSATPTFTAKQGNLPTMPVYASCILLNHGNEVILGTEMGVFTTQNITATPVVWTEESSVIGNVPVFMIYQQTMDRYHISLSGITYPAVNNLGAIYFGTHGRGFFECRNYVSIKDEETIEANNKPQLKIYPNPVKDNATIEYSIYKNSNVTVKVYSLNGTEIDEFNLGNKPSGNYTFKINCSSYNTGTYLVSITSNGQSKAVKMMVTK